MATIIGEELGIDPDKIRIVHADSLNAPVTRSPVASRMAIMLGSSTAAAAQKIIKKVVAIGAYNFGVREEQVEYVDGTLHVVDRTAKKMTWEEVCFIAHKAYHKMPSGMEPGAASSACISSAWRR